MRRLQQDSVIVLNQINAVSTDTMHRIRFFEGVDHQKALLSYYNSITFAFTEMEGRSYGGGVLEVLPREAENIIVPNIKDLDKITANKLLQLIDNTIRLNGNIDEMLDEVDKTVLIEHLGLEENIVRSFREIWKKLMNRRRQRISIKRVSK